MCKVFMVAGVKPSTVEKVWKFTQAIAKPMSKFNSDGIGYAAITADGKLFGERWLNNNHMFKKQDDGNDKMLVDMFGDAIEGKTDAFEYSSFGEVDHSKMVALTLHTRMATSPKGLLNTHPFVYDNTSLIHNGVIRNTEDFNFTLSTCDSEAILISYLKQEVKKDPANFDKAAKMLRGYYACGVLTNTEEGPILDIFKSGARLHIAYVKELETWVASTDDDDIKNTCKDLNYSMGNLFTVLNGKLIRVNAVTGKEKSITKFEMSSENYYSGNYSSGNHYTPSKNPPNSANVLPWGKRRSNTQISEHMMDYFRSGVRSCTRLSDRDIQEQIMEQERLYGESRW
jgi:predicted glutamine amidotransferase